MPFCILELDEILEILEILSDFIVSFFKIFYFEEMSIVLNRNVVTYFVSRSEIDFMKNQVVCYNSTVEELNKGCTSHYFAHFIS